MPPTTTKFRVGRGLSEELPSRYIDGFIWFATDTGKLYIDSSRDGIITRTLINPEVDWSQIENKPVNLACIYYNTTAGWNEQITLRSELNAMYVYTDGYVENNVNIPRIKIGDGTSYLIDMPFLDSELISVINEHIADASIHVSMSDREFWNNKVRAYYSDVQNDTLVFTTQ